MTQPIGRLLEDPNTFFNWINGAAGALIALNGTVQSGLLDCLGDGPRSIEDLASDVGFPPDRLARLLNYLVAHEVVDLLPDGRIAPNAHTGQLRDAGTCVQCTNIGVVAGSHLDAALRSGKTAYEECYGAPVFVHLGSDPKLGAMFNDFMSFMSRSRPLPTSVAARATFSWR